MIFVHTLPLGAIWNGIAQLPRDAAYAAVSTVPMTTPIFEMGKIRLYVQIVVEITRWTIVVARCDNPCHVYNFYNLIR
jgi:hypothetical protein